MKELSHQQSEDLICRLRDDLSAKAIEDIAFAPLERKALQALHGFYARQEIERTTVKPTYERTGEESYCSVCGVRVRSGSTECVMHSIARRSAASLSLIVFLISLSCLAIDLPPIPELKTYKGTDIRRGAERLMSPPKPRPRASAVIGGPGPVTFSMAVAEISPHSVRLAWDESPSTNILGYSIFVGSSPTFYTNRIDVGMNLTTIVPDLSGGDYFFVARCYNAETNSEFSNVVEYVVPSIVLTTRILSSASMSGPWTDTGVSLSLTNPAPPLYFKLNITTQ